MKAQKLESTISQMNISVKLENEEVQARNDLEAKELFSQNETMCQICSKSFTSTADLETHMKHFCDKVKSQTCNLCNKSFGQNDSLQNHMKTVHAKVNVSCHSCDKMFVNKYNLKAHQKTIH